MHDLAAPAPWIIGLICAIPWGWVFYMLGAWFERRRRDHVEKLMSDMLATAMFSGLGATEEIRRNVSAALLTAFRSVR